MEVIADLVDRELSVLANDQHYQAALATIEDLQKPIFERLGSEVQTNLKQLLPSIRSVRIGPAPTGRLRSRLRPPQFVVDDGIATGLEAKGDGIKSLVAIALMRASKVDASVGDLIVAIEEPESHLHPGAIRQLGNVLEEMANAHQVIITTHSPLLVARSRIGANIIVSKSKATSAVSIKAVRDALGVESSDNLQNAEFVILVEGQSDVKILTELFSSRSGPFSEMLKVRKVIFDEMGGASNIIYKLRTIANQVAKPIVILDDVSAGRVSEKKIVADGALSSRNVFLWKRPGVEGSELEDLLNPQGYWEMLESEFGATLDRPSFEASDQVWKRRMATAFQASGKTWNTSVESNVKTALAETVARNPTSSILPEREELVDNVIAAILKLVRGPIVG